jgi:hypothetical protein
MPRNANRVFIREGRLDVLKDNLKEHMVMTCLMFDDCLVFVETQSKKRKYAFKALVPLDSILVVAIDDNSRMKMGMVFYFFSSS